MAEILLVVEAEHPRQSDSHIGVSAEVEVYLEEVGDSADPGDGDVDLARGGAEHRIGSNRHRIRHKHLLRQAHAKAPETRGHALKRDGTSIELGFDIVVFDDRAGDELRKERDVQKNLQIASLGGDFPAVHIYHIRHRLERVKRYADGKSDVRIGDACSEQPVHRRNEHPRILEEPQKCQVGNHRNRNDRLRAAAGALADRKAKSPVRQRGNHHEGHVHGLAIRIEHQAGDGKQDVFRPHAGNGKRQ